MTLSLTITAHGATLHVTDDAVRIDYSPLLAALVGQATNTVSFGAQGITSATVHPPTTISPGSVILAGDELPGGHIDVRFSPRQGEQATLFYNTVRAVLSGEDIASLPGAPPVIGLDFVAVDVETANAEWGSICQIGAVIYRDGVEDKAKQWLCQPPGGYDEFDERNIAIHGITANDVADAVSFSDALNELIDFSEDLVLIAHNAQFDATALRRAAIKAGALQALCAQERFFGCTLAASRSLDLDVDNHRLPSIAEAFGVEITKHHDALADARACGEIACGIARATSFSGKGAALMHSLGFTLGSITYDKVQPVLKDRSGAGIAIQKKLFTRAPAQSFSPPDSQDSGTEGTSTVGEAVQEALLTHAEATSDGQPDPTPDAGNKKKNQRRGPAPWESVATPDKVPEPNENADKDHVLYGENVTLTGDFEPFEKGMLWNGIAHHGATVGKNVTKKTTILVVGEWASTTSKEKRARELIDAGQDLKIWPMSTLIEALGLDEEPPF